MDPKELFVGTICNGALSARLFAAILNRSCSDVYDRLGIYSLNLPSRFYLNTHEKSPFALYYLQ